jgi:hypothetical protein
MTEKTKPKLPDLDLRELNISEEDKTTLKLLMLIEGT